MGLRGRYKSTGDDAYRMLRAIFSTALTDGLVARSPCQVKGAGNARSGERPVASMAEVTVAVEAMPERFQLAGMLAAWCQLRRGEILGLQRRDVDLLHAELHIERAFVRPMNGNGTIGPPKTKAGRRTLAIPRNVMPAVEAHLGRFVARDPAAWLFAGEDGRPTTPSTLDRAWQRGRAEIGRTDLFLHDLRHSGLTWAAATGASVAELMRRGGHQHPAAALRYQHATADRDRALADALAGLAQQITPIRSGAALPDA
jgi:integrase